MVVRITPDLRHHFSQPRLLLALRWREWLTHGSRLARSTSMRPGSSCRSGSQRERRSSQAAASLLRPRLLDKKRSNSVAIMTEPAKAKFRYQEIVLARSIAQKLFISVSHYQEETHRHQRTDDDGYNGKKTVLDWVHYTNVPIKRMIPTPKTATMSGSIRSRSARCACASRTRPLARSPKSASPTSKFRGC